MRAMQAFMLFRCLQHNNLRGGQSLPSAFRTRSLIFSAAAAVAVIACSLLTSALLSVVISWSCLSASRCFACSSSLSLQDFFSPHFSSDFNSWTRPFPSHHEVPTCSSIRNEPGRAEA